jgi:hypothetical protein
MSCSRSASLGLYRSLLRVALQLPDDHRRALVVFRARSVFCLLSPRQPLTTPTGRADFELSRSLPHGSPEQAERWLDGEIYRDNLEVRSCLAPALALCPPLILSLDPQHQAAHLNSLARTSTLIPIDLRRSSHPHTCSNPSHSHSHESHSQLLPPITGTQDRRKLLRAIAARKDGATRRSGSVVDGGRFMKGPEPSWIAKEGRKSATGGA